MRTGEPPRRNAAAMADPTKPLAPVTKTGFGSVMTHATFDNGEEKFSRDWIGAWWRLYPQKRHTFQVSLSIRAARENE
jgi:hypothetical protein